MSAHMISKSLMDLVVDGVQSQSKQSGYNPLDLPIDDRDALGRRLYKMNGEAIEARYPDVAGQPEHYPGAELGWQFYRYNRRSVVKAIHAYAALSSYLYQCSEGTVPSSELYGFIEWIKASLADEIISELDGYLPAYKLRDIEDNGPVLLSENARTV